MLELDEKREGWIGCSWGVTEGNWNIYSVGERFLNASIYEDGEEVSLDDSFLR